MEKKIHKSKLSLMELGMKANKEIWAKRKAELAKEQKKVQEDEKTKEK